MNPKLLQTYLQSVDVPDSTRADAWDVFHQSQTPAEFQERVKKLNLPDDTKERLFDMRWNPKMSYQTFSAGIKSQYPEYAGMDDFELAQRVIAKYPQYRDSIALSQPPKTVAQGHVFQNPLGPGSVGYKPQDKFSLQPLPAFSGFSQAELEAGRLGASVPGVPGTVPDPSKPYSDRQDYFRRPGFVQYGENGFLRTPDEQEQISNLPLQKRLAATASPHAQHIQQQTEEMVAAKNLAQEKGGEAGANFFEYEASHPGVTAGEFGTFLPPEITPETKVSLSPETKGVVRGVGSFAGSMAADPMTYALLGLAPEGQLGRTLMSAGFSGQMGYSAVKGAGQLGEIWDRDDIPKEQKVELGTQVVLDTLMAGGTGAHAVLPFLSDHPILSSIPQEDRAVVASRVQKAVNGSSEPFLLRDREDAPTDNT